MKIKLIQNSLGAPEKRKGARITLCDDEAKEFVRTQLREEREVDLLELKKKFDAFNDQRGKLPDTAASFRDSMLLAANFPAEDIYRILKQNEGGVLFLRIYLGINETGEHILCVAPVDMNKQLIRANGTIYSTQCCGVPPNGVNFKGDPILGL